MADLAYHHRPRSIIQQLKRKAEAGPCDDGRMAVQATLAWEEEES